LGTAVNGYLFDLIKEGELTKELFLDYLVFLYVLFILAVAPTIDFDRFLAVGD
jgi:hypothetical protein